MILIDANVLLEILLPGRPKRNAVLEWLEDVAEPFCVSMLSVHLILHFGQKTGLSLGDIRIFLANFPKVALLAEDYTASMKLLNGQDHEDALQLAQAERAGCNTIATLDRQFAKTYGHRIQFVIPGQKVGHAIG